MLLAVGILDLAEFTWITLSNLPGTITQSAFMDMESESSSPSWEMVDCMRQQKNGTFRRGQVKVKKPKRKKQAASNSQAHPKKKMQNKAASNSQAHQEKEMQNKAASNSQEHPEEAGTACRPTIPYLVPVISYPEKKMKKKAASTSQEHPEKEMNKKAASNSQAHPEKETQKKAASNSQAHPDQKMNKKTSWNTQVFDSLQKRR